MLLLVPGPFPGLPHFNPLPQLPEVLLQAK